jgi:phosphinothricin acetyltransferase
VEVRLVQDRDFPAIAALTNHFIRTSAIHFGYHDVTADELRAAWREHAELHPFLVAEHGGKFAGYAKASSWRARQAYQWTVETGLYVQSEQHGRGIGRALYERLLDLLRRQGFRTVVAGITLPNAVSVALHERFGFRSAGTVHHAGFKRGSWHDVGFWQLDLQPEGEGGGELLSPQEAWVQE